MIVDTSALYAFFDSKDPHHQEVVEVLEQCQETLTVSPFVVAELDYLVLSRLGVKAALAVLEELCGGAWQLAAVSADTLRRSLEIVGQFADQPIGVTDAANVALAEETGTTVIATLDRRHFAVLRHAGGSCLDIVP